MTRLCGRKVAPGEKPQGRPCTALWLGLVVAGWLGLGHATPVRAGSLFLDAGQRVSMLWGLDAYYTFLGFNASLLPPIKGENVLDAGAESNVYAYLLRHFYVPRTLTVELSVNPLPIFGAYLKHEEPRLYRRGDVGRGINTIKSISEGFPDPGAISLVLGNNVFLVNATTGETEGMGFGGFLASFGNYHIVNNTMVADDWVETEAKLKGVALSNARQNDFSFRLGAKFHSNRDINNSYYLSLKRSHTERTYFTWSPLRNSDFEARLDINIHNAAPARVLLLFGKRFPTPGGRYVLALAVGALGVFAQGYRGALARESVNAGWTLLVRPNITF